MGTESHQLCYKVLSSKLLTQFQYFVKLSTTNKGERETSETNNSLISSHLPLSILTLIPRHRRGQGGIMETRLLVSVLSFPGVCLQTLEPLSPDYLFIHKGHSLLLYHWKLLNLAKSYLGRRNASEKLKRKEAANRPCQFTSQSTTNTPKSTIATHSPPDPTIKIVLLVVLRPNFRGSCITKIFN